MTKRRRTSKRNDGIPEAPFKHGETVKVKLADGTYRVGTVSLVGYMPFPGIWSFEVKSPETLDGRSETYKSHGISDLPRIVALGGVEEEF